MEKLIQAALAAGASNASVLPVAQIPFDPLLRKLCEANRCGKYNRNYGCPPFVGTAEEVIGRAKQYENALVIQTINELEDSYDVEGMAESGARHNRITREVAQAAEAEYPECIALAAGGCTLCERCACLDGEACRFPEKVVPSLSSFCINVSKMAGKCGMKYINGVNTVTYFSVILF